jgi:hypothetical protein
MKISRQIQGQSTVSLDASCAGCQFFVEMTDVQKQTETARLGTAKEGQCRCGPPGDAGHWPPVDGADWCGEFYGK